MDTHNAHPHKALYSPDTNLACWGDPMVFGLYKQKLKCISFDVKNNLSYLRCLFFVFKKLSPLVLIYFGTQSLDFGASWMSIMQDNHA